MTKKKRNIIIIVILAILVIIFILLKVFKKDNFNERLVTFLNSKNYVKDTGTMYAFEEEEYPYLVCKETTDDCIGRKYYFDTSTYKLVLDEVFKTEGIEFSFTPTYNYQTSETSYFYRIRYQNGSIVIKGEYSEDSFTCDVDYSYGISVTDKSVYCDPLEEKLETFNSYSHLLIDDMTLLKRMQNKK